MSELDSEDLAKFTDVLDAFTAAQRQDALFQTKRQRLTVARHVGDMQVGFEAVIDEGTPADEIFAILAPLDGAIDRLKAKADLSDHYTRMANACNAIDAAVKKLTALRDEYRVKNGNINRRTPIVFTDAQAANLEGQGNSIKDLFEQIRGHQEAAAECRRVLGGEDPFRVLDEQITKRLDLLRGVRPDAA